MFGTCNYYTYKKWLFHLLLGVPDKISQLVDPTKTCEMRRKLWKQYIDLSAKSDKVPVALRKHKNVVASINSRETTRRVSFTLFEGLKKTYNRD